MPARNADLHGNVPDKSDVAILLIDVINDLEFSTGDRLLAPAMRMASQLSRLARRARRLRIPVIYVNDNFGKWRSDFRELLTHCLEDDVRGRPIAEQLKPDPADYFVLKPKNSGFYNTTLSLLLQYLGVKTVVLTGITTDNCVLFTAYDAYMRDLEVIVPRDCVASSDPAQHRSALAQMRRVLKARTEPQASVDLERLAVRRERTNGAGPRRARSGSRGRAPRPRGRDARTSRVLRD